MPIEITSRSAGFRRGGVAHPVEPTVYADDHFTEEQLAAIKAEKELRVREMTDDEAEALKPDSDATDTDSDDDDPDKGNGIGAKIFNLFKSKGIKLDTTPGRCQGITTKDKQCGVKNLAEGILFCETHADQNPELTSEDEVK